MHSEHSLHVALHFPEGHQWKIEGWFWGKPMNAKTRIGTIWLNFTEPGEKYERTDDLQVALDTLTADNYGKLWAVVAPKSFMELQAAVSPAASPPTAAAEATDEKSAEDESGAQVHG